MGAEEEVSCGGQGGGGGGYERVFNKEKRWHSDPIPTPCHARAKTVTQTLSLQYPVFQTNCALCITRTRTTGNVSIFSMV